MTSHIHDIEASIDISLQSLGKRRIDTPADGHCLMRAWALGTKIDIEVIKLKLKGELLIHQTHYTDFITERSIREIIYEYIDCKRYFNDDMDILLHALCNAFQMEAILYEIVNDDYIVTNTYSPGRVVANNTIELF